ncbi:MAG: rod-binding protein [Pseudobdellovibrio sp.]
MSDVSKMNSTNFVNHFKSLNEKKEVSSHEADAKVREVADVYEKYFLKEMMKQMRSTVQEGGLLKANNAEKIFQEQLDDQYSAEWNKRGGFGLSDLIYQQLTDKFGAQLGIKSEDKPLKGPIPFENKVNVKHLGAHDISQSDKQKSTTFVLEPEKSNTDRNIEVKSPWAGVLQNKKILEGDRTSYEIKHDNGLESLILTQGAPSEKTRYLAAGDKLEAGQPLGLAESTSPLVWTVKSSVSE